MTRGPESGAYYHPQFQRGELVMCARMQCLDSKAIQKSHPMSEVAMGHHIDGTYNDAAFREKGPAELRLEAIQSQSMFQRSVAQHQVLHGGLQLESSMGTSPQPNPEDVVSSPQSPLLATSESRREGPMAQMLRRQQGEIDSLRRSIDAYERQYSPTATPPPSSGGAGEPSADSRFDLPSARITDGSTLDRSIKKEDLQGTHQR